MEYTAQQVFDKVATHLLTQKEQSLGAIYTDSEFGDIEGCVYRGKDGKMCAFGCLIPDELYDPKMENETASSVIAEYPKLKAMFDKDSMGLLVELQDLHDGIFPENWKNALTELADRNNLKTEVLNQF